MQCSNCHNSLPDGARFCNLCGMPVPPYPVPEGYQLDSASGLYYSSVMATDPSTGGEVQWVTYFNANSGEYSQASYPIQNPQESLVIENVDEPIAEDTTNGEDLLPSQLEKEEEVVLEVEYQPETEQPLEIVEVQTTQADQAVAESLNQPQTETIVEQPPLEPAVTSEPITTEQTNLSHQATQPQAPTQPQEYVSARAVIASLPKKPTKKKNKAAPVLVILCLVLLGGFTYFSKIYQQIPFFKAEPAMAVNVSPAQDAPSFIVIDKKISDPQQQQQEAQRQEAQQEIPLGTPIGMAQSTEQWYDFPQISEYYMGVQEDAQHIYFLQPDETQYLQGILFRMDKNGDNLVNMSRFVNGSENINSFTLLGDYIYFAMSVDEERSGYYRVSKSGGDAEFLFIQETAQMQSYKGDIYFTFAEQLAYGVYTPEKDHLPRLTTLTSLVSANSYEPPYLLKEFSIYNGYFYYGYLIEDTGNYTRRNLQTGEEEIILDGAALAQSNVYNPVFEGDTAYYVQCDPSFENFAVRRVVLKGAAGDSQILTSTPPETDYYTFVARFQDRLVYQEGAQYRVAYFDDVFNTQTLFTNQSEPYGISSEWLFFYGEAVSATVADKKVSMNAAKDGPSISLYQAKKEARDLAERYPNDKFIAK